MCICSRSRCVSLPLICLDLTSAAALGRNGELESVIGRSANIYHSYCNRVAFLRESEPEGK